MRANFLTGVAVGAVAVWFGPDLWRSARPLTRAALRAGVRGYVDARRAAARFAEDVEDLIAESAAELAERSAEAGIGEDVIRPEGAASAASA